MAQLFVSSLLFLAIGFAIHYALILGGSAAAAGSPERKNYEALEARLRAGGTPAKVYNEMLVRALDAADRFFGDAGRADARWTARAYARCLPFALLYLVATFFLIWVVTGHSGEGGKSLLLDDGSAWWRRAASLIAVAISCSLACYGIRAEGWRRLVAVAVAIAVAITGAITGAVAVAIAGAIAVAIAGAVAEAVTVVIAGAVVGAVGAAIVVAIAVAVAGAVAGILSGPGPGGGAVAVATALAGAVTIALAVAFAVAGGVAAAAAGAVGVIFVLDWAEQRGRLGAGLAAFTIVFGAACLIAPVWLALMPGWPYVGALLLFFGLFTLVRAPFDWLALGVTRALLRHGVARGGWSPFAYTLISVVASMAFGAVLAFAMVLAAQAFDDFAVRGGGSDAHILEFQSLLNRLRSDPTAPQNAWVWFTLLSPSISSVVNLTIVCISILRGLAPVHAWLLARMPIDGAMSRSDQLLVAGALTVEVVAGAAVTAATLYVFATKVVWLVMPCLATAPLDFARATRDANGLAHWLVP